MSNQSHFWDFFVAFWKFEVFVVDGQPMTIGKIAVGVFLLFLGYFVSRFLSRAVRQKFLTRLNIEPSLQHTWQTLIFYFFFLGFFLFVLQLLNIPITIFAVLGGALAIGVGFGSQNLVSNFISGLIVMVERPVRIHDLVEIEGHTGQVEQIGTRSTMIRTVENKQIVIPNSKFLDTSFVNWTLSDDIVANKVSVGVAYTSNANKVSELLIKAAASHPKVKAHPAPTALLVNFGESSLDFEVVYWHQVDPDYGPGRIRSEIRFKILELFEQNNVSIPFPHREVIMRNNV